ncbi:MAG TPA: energy transducer TonB [Flavobacteriales bacterium]|nr:energy transducer TonB [Flavobacteriales bacterium]
MKIHTTVLLLLLCFQGIAQDSTRIEFEIRPTYSRAIKMETLSTAKTMADVCPGFPTTWISDYKKTEVSAMINGQTITATGKNDTLTTEQLSVFAQAILGTNIDIRVEYKYANPITDHMDDFEIVFTLTVIPSTEAQYSSGMKELRQYIRESAIAKLTEEKPNQFKQTKILFTVDEQGDVVNAKLIGTSNSKKTDRLLLKTIHNMPRWAPAVNSKGENVKQEFEFIVFGESTISGC